MGKITFMMLVLAYLVFSLVTSVSNLEKSEKSGTEYLATSRGVTCSKSFFIGSVFMQTFHSLQHWVNQSRALQPIGATVLLCAYSLLVISTSIMAKCGYKKDKLRR